ncbi:MAG: saccharopine dehydrogenase NADP-binding domain-containing protein, partial [Anaerolineales bacterium]|nr:saccharopine dehydrogenase NADP-binding domain-containing protein [Anaerolineales bacterium]
MDILVIGGSGKIGATVAWDLVKSNDVNVVGLVDRRADALERTKAWINNSKIKAHVLDIADTQAVKSLMGQYDVGVITLPDRKTSYKVVEIAIAAGLNIVDILEE